MSGQRILVLETDGAWRESVGRSLRDARLEVRSGFRVPDLDSLPEICRPHVIILAPLGTDCGRALAVARRIRVVDRRISVLFVAARSSEELAIAALRAGVTEYLKHPFSRDELDEAILRCSPGHEAPVDLSPGKLAGDMVGESLPIRQVKSYIAKIADSSSNVLITGETGTGKELAAEMVHRCSGRRDKPFITINSAAIPDNLFESELFGFDRGAFTGAEYQNEGKLAAANGGSIFLDEIADLSASAQAKILRAIENKELYRLGSKRATPINIRFIAATNQNLEDLIAEGKFRKDLFFRLNVAQVHLPPLRERKEDLPFLLDHFVRRLNQRSGLQVQRFTDDAIEHLLAYDWPGNVRELKNLLEVIFVDLPSSEISLESLPVSFRMRCERCRSAPRTEQDELLSALLSTKWNKSKAAEKLRWSRMTLYRKMARYNIAKADAHAAARSPTDA